MTKSDATVELAQLEEMWGAPAADARPRRTHVARRLLIAWSVIFGGVLLFAPAPDNSAPLPAWEALIGMAFLGVVTTAFYGLARARSWALKASMTAALFGVAGGIACNVVDHHTGSWWLVETGGFSALALMTAAAARHRSLNTQ